MRAWSSVVVVAVVASGAGALNCYGQGPGLTQSTANDSGAKATTELTYYKDIAPIVSASCLGGCHVAGGISPFSLETYADVKAHAAGIVEETAAQRMPPWGAQETAECVPIRGWKNDLRLQKPALDTLSAWQSGGTPEGDPKDFKAAEGSAPPTSLPGMQQELAPKTPFVAAGDKDEFRCFSLDPQLTEDKYINGTFVVPGNPKVVHHVLLFSDPNSESVAKGEYDCFGGSQVSGTALLAAWAPGAVPSEYEPNLGTPIKAGSKIVMQVHYHPGGRSNNAPDTTKIQLRYTAAKPEYALIPSLIGNFQNPVGAAGIGLLPDPDDRDGKVEFRIPAGAANHHETMQYTLPAIGTDASIYFIGSHMHWVGQDLKVDVTREAPVGTEPAQECLMQTPKYNFSWQRTYTYKSSIADLPKIHPGDKITVRCGYNNTMANSQLQVALQEQRLTAPQDVKLGEQTLDEMCLAVVGAVLKNP